MIAHANWILPDTPVVEPPLGYVSTVIFIPPDKLFQATFPIISLVDGVDLDDLKVIFHEDGVEPDDGDQDQE